MCSKQRVLRAGALSALAVGLAALSACVATFEQAPPWVHDAVVTHAVPTAAWWVLVDGEVVGSLVRFEPPDAPRTFMIMVRNRHGQDIGVIDSLGRAFRERPHRAQPEWIGTGTVIAGTARLLGLEEAPLLESVAPRGLLEHAIDSPLSPLPQVENQSLLILSAPQPSPQNLPEGPARGPER